MTDALDRIFLDVPLMTDAPNGACVRIDFPSRKSFAAAERGRRSTRDRCRRFPAGRRRGPCPACLRRLRPRVAAVLCFGHRGQRFLGCGLGPETHGVRIDAYGSTGDYLGSGMDGLDLYVHGNGQDQIGQILKSGKLVVYGDVGQTFMYGAKGGEVYVLGNAAGRPLINAAGRPRVVINGTALDFLAESFMAGDPYNGGGFVIVNGLAFDDEGRVVPQETPYPGSNLFSLASGGAIFVRDPEGALVDEQLNGGQFLPFGDAEWDLIRPYLEENERLFGITVDELLTVNGKRRKPHDVYRMIGAVKLSVLAAGAGGTQEWEDDE